MPSERGTADGGQSALLRPFLAAPERSAVLTDVDGTLAPIVARPEQAAVPAEASRVLLELRERYGLVGCISGRRAEEARRLVGIDELAYAGNHGLELLLPGREEPVLDRFLPEIGSDAAAFVATLDLEQLAEMGLRLEDKGPIQALHWRGADDEDAAEAAAQKVATAAGEAGLVPHRGRKVLELRPFGGGGKDAAVAGLLRGTRLRHAIYAGDDQTDRAAFRKLRELQKLGELETAICVGVVSPEGPPQLAAESDLTVDGPAGWLAILEALAD